MRRIIEIADDGFACEYVLTAPGQKLVIETGYVHIYNTSDSELRILTRPGYEVPATLRKSLTEM